MFIVLLAEELALLLHEANAHEGNLAVGVGAVETLGTPGLVQGQNKRTPEREIGGHPLHTLPSLGTASVRCTRQSPT